VAGVVPVVHDLHDVVEGMVLDHHATEGCCRQYLRHSQWKLQQRAEVGSVAESLACRVRCGACAHLPWRNVGNRGAAGSHDRPDLQPYATG